ncbi:hypothetical protein ABH924_004406 [Arthrobacter sp. GAS37]
MIDCACPRKIAALSAASAAVEVSGSPAGSKAPSPSDTACSNDPKLPVNPVRTGPRYQSRHRTPEKLSPQGNPLLRHLQNRRRRPTKLKSGHSRPNQGTTEHKGHHLYAGSMQIRESTLADLGPVNAVCDASGRTRWTIEMIAPRSDRVVLVAVAQGEVVGVAKRHFHPDPEGGCPAGHYLGGVVVLRSSADEESVLPSPGRDRNGSGLKLRSLTTSQKNTSRHPSGCTRLSASGRSPDSRRSAA